MLYFLIIPLYFHYVHVHGSPVSSLFFLPNDKPVPQEVKPQNIVIHVKKAINVS